MPVVERLLLWDVDGTLVRVGQLGAASFDVAVRQVTGREIGTRPRMSGKTDRQIVREYLEDLAIPEEEGLVARILEALEAALNDFAPRLTETGDTPPGTAAILQRMADDPAVHSTVLTGNIKPNARTKLAAFDLDRWLDLDTGAYGSDHADRPALVPIALGRAAELRGVHVEPDQVWVIGDTPRDLACARAAGARCLLVGTGRMTVAEAATLGADAVVEDLSDTDAVAKLLTGP